MAEILLSTGYSYPTEKGKLDKIGDYTDPKTGEKDWIEPITINDLFIISERVKKIGDTDESFVDFKLNYKTDEHIVTFTASYNKYQVSYQIDLMGFADELVNLYYSNLSINASNFINDLKTRAVKELTETLFDENIILNDFKLDGIGFIMVDNKKTITVDRIEVSRSKENDILVKLIKCVGLSELKNLENPSLIFNTDKHIIEISNIKFIDGNDFRIKDYNVKVESIKVSKQTNVIEIKHFDDEDDFICDRSKKLDNIYDEEDELNDRFDDIF